MENIDLPPEQMTTNSEMELSILRPATPASRAFRAMGAVGAPRPCLLQAAAGFGAAAVQPSPQQ